MGNILRKYTSSIKMRQKSFFLPFAVCLLLHISSFPAMLDTSLEQRETMVVVHVFLSVLPEEEVSGIQLECGYDAQNWEFVSAFPGDTLWASSKQLQVAKMYGLLRVLIIGLNNHPIPSGELFTVQFNALSEGTNGPGFNILQVKLSSPQAQPVSATVNSSQGSETSTDNNPAEEIPPSDTNNSTTSTGTEMNHQIDNQSDVNTNITDMNTEVKPVIQRVANTETRPIYSQSSSTKASSSTSSSGFVTNIS
ncbi:MAG: cohesin domain-containing protein, partial [Candidatus Hydrogenedens sp.]